MSFTFTDSGYITEQIHYFANKYALIAAFGVAFMAPLMLWK